MLVTSSLSPILMQSFTMHWKSSRRERTSSLSLKFCMTYLMASTRNSWASYSNPYALKSYPKVGLHKSKSCVKAEST